MRLHTQYILRAVAILVLSFLLRIVPAFALQPPQLNVAPGQEYTSSTRMYQAAPTIERTRAGRLWAAWVSGGPDEGPFNYVLLVTSTDDGKSWSDAELIIDPPGNVAASDPRLWYDQRGRLWLFWSQGYAASDGRDGVWATIAEHPDVTSPSWSQPIRIADGRIGGKSIILKDGEWL